MRVLNIDEDPYIRETYMAPGKMDGPQPFEFLQQAAYYFASGSQFARDLLSVVEKGANQKAHLLNTK